MLYATAASKQSTVALRSETSFLVPLWPHVFERPEVGPDAGVSALDPQVLMLDHRGESSGAVISPVVWVPEYDVAAPCAVARIAGDQRSFAHRTWSVSLGGVAFRLVGFQEVVAPYGGLLSAGGLPVLDAFTGAGDGLAEQIDVDANASDNGLLDLWEARYIKRAYTLSIVLNSRTQILDFRRLLFALRGRLNPVRWTAPGDVEQRTWRLASDAVELSYPYGSIYVRVFELETDAPDTAYETIWRGRIRSCAHSEITAELTGTNGSERMQRLGLRLKGGSACQWDLYGPKCGLSEAAYTRAGSVLAVAPDGLTVTTTLAEADNWFKAGKVRARGQARMVLKNTGGVLTLMSPIPGLAPGDAIEASKGCDRSASATSGCKSFNNYLNYSGFEGFQTPRNIFSEGA